jgi:hypothetical protein
MFWGSPSAEAVTGASEGRCTGTCAFGRLPTSSVAVGAVTDVAWEEVTTT